MTRRRRGNDDGSRVHPSAPLSLFCFDLLHVDGRDLLDEPLSERIAVMAAGAARGADRPPAGRRHVDEVSAVFADAVAAGFEGVVVKKLDAPYAAGPAGFRLGQAQAAAHLRSRGHRRRMGLRPARGVAVEPAPGRPGSAHRRAGDAGQDLQGADRRDADLADRAVPGAGSPADRGTVYVDPPLVAEIAIDGVQASTRYPGGVALRFARVLRYRPDKTPEEVDTIDAVIALGAPAGGQS